MNFIPMGRITNVHGIRGALKIKTDSDFKEHRYKAGQRLYISDASEPIPVTVKGYFEKKDFDVVSFQEFDNVNQVEKYKGRDLLVHEDDREALLDDEFYFSELIDKDVYVASDKLGTVKEVREYPQAAMLIVITISEKRALIPFLKRYVQTVTEDKIILVDDARELL